MHDMKIELCFSVFKQNLKGLFKISNLWVGVRIAQRHFSTVVNLARSDTLARGITFAQNDTLARRHFCTE